ncbi:MFS transporter [Gordonia aquimaris]|uniref:MFS transporter n=1 Tax=Gordonia aquimaris TaxID=2984863 RepID=A0A9X3D0W6_9ACTN|nr:MFS transporter [Gordonia aquimaris]MCX2962793.1 MFS transporter [Gordonia aquimaris]
MPSSRRGAPNVISRYARDGTGRGTAGQSGAHPLIVFLLCCCGMLASFLATALVPAAGSLGDYLGVSATSGSWALTATFLAAAASTPIAGRAADIAGERRVLTALVAVIAVGSIFCAFADHLVPMVVGRALQGCGAGVIPVGMSIIRRLLGPSRAAVGASTMSIAVGLGGGAGLPLAAWTIQDLGIPALFWTAAGAALTLTAAVAMAVPPDVERSGEPFDAFGAVGMVVLMLCVLIPVAQGARWGWTSPLVLGLLGAGAVVTALWLLFELRHRCPLVDIRAVASPAIAAANTASGLVGLVYMMATLSASQLLQTPPVPPFAGMGQSILVAGVLLTPGGLSMLVSTPLAARLVRAIGAPLTLAVGTSIVVLGYLFLLFWHGAPWQISVGVTVVSAGVGMAMTATPVMISASTPSARMAAGQALNVVARFAGTAVASALVVAVLEAFGSSGAALDVGYRTLFVIGVVIAAGTCVLAVCSRRWAGDVIGS